MIVEGLVDWRLSALMNIQEEPGFKDSFQDLIRQGQRSIIVGAPHESHFNAFEQAWVASRLMAYKREVLPSVEPRGYALLVAESVRSGHQSRFMKRVWGLARATVSGKGLEWIPYTRVKDRQYGLEPSIREFLLYAEKLRTGVADPATLPEGSVQAGRHPKDKGIDEIFGMQELTNKALLDNYKLITTSENGEKIGGAFFVPVAHHGSYRIYNPHDLEKPTAEAIDVLIGRSAQPLVDITILKPITEDHLQEELGPQWDRDYLALNRFVMSRIARVIPPQAQGAYREVIAA